MSEDPQENCPLLNNEAASKNYRKNRAVVIFTLCKTHAFITGQVITLPLLMSLTCLRFAGTRQGTWRPPWVPPPADLYFSEAGTFSSLKMRNRFLSGLLVQMQHQVVLVFCHCCKKSPQMQWLESTRTCYLEICRRESSMSLAGPPHTCR